MDQRPHVVVIGAGFAGLYCTRNLERAPVRVTLIDRRNYHLFQPLLYQVATAGLNPADIAYPVRSLIRHQKNLDVLMADVSGFDLTEKQVILSSGVQIPYDYLVIATGATHSYFGHSEWSRYAPGLKTVEDALEIRRRVLAAFEEADREADPKKRESLLTFVVVGGGPTGVELAGALAEIARHTLASEFRHIDPTTARVILLEGMGRILPPFPTELSEKARRQLVDLGVEVHTGSMVTNIDAEGVSLGEYKIPARTVLWGAGIAASPLARALGAPLDRAGRVKVNPDLTVPGHPEVYVAGDLALAMQANGAPVPGVAPAAMQEGRYVARHIERSLSNKQREPFKYWNKGILATIGRARAVGAVGKMQLSGILAWFTWLFIHIFFLIGFRNRFAVISQWAWHYATFGRGRGARLIVDTAERWQNAVSPAEKKGIAAGATTTVPAPPPSAAAAPTPSAPAPTGNSGS